MATFGEAGPVTAISEIPFQKGTENATCSESGYRSNSANFRSIVNQTLIKDKRFGSAGRGVYQLKKAS